MNDAPTSQTVRVALPVDNVRDGDSRGLGGRYRITEELVRVLNINGFVPVKGGQPLGSPNTQIDPTA